MDHYSPENTLKPTDSNIDSIVDTPYVMMYHYLIQSNLGGYPHEYHQTPLPYGTLFHRIRISIGLFIPPSYNI